MKYRDTAFESSFCVDNFRRRHRHHLFTLLYFTLVVHVYKYLCLSVIKQMKRMKEETITSATETETAITLTCRHMSESHFRCSGKELKLTLWDACLCVCINKTLPPPRPPSPISIEIYRTNVFVFITPPVSFSSPLSKHFFIPLASPKFAMSHRISTIDFCLIGVLSSQKISAFIQFICRLTMEILFYFACYGNSLHCCRDGAFENTFSRKQNKTKRKMG